MPDVNCDKHPVCELEMNTMKEHINKLTERVDVIEKDNNKISNLFNTSIVRIEMTINEIKTKLETIESRDKDKRNNLIYPIIVGVSMLIIGYFLGNLFR
jgi:hypothetical protein